jgi:MFS family permease
MSTATAPAPLKLAAWRTPMVLIVVGCVIALIAFGPRSALGQFLTPMSFDRGWGREAFSFAIAVQNLLWGAMQPFAGGVADKFGPTRVLCAGAILYAAGLAWMSQATTILGLDLAAGVMIGFGLAGCSFPMVVGALGKLVPENWRGFAFGAGTASGSFGQFLYSPLAHSLIEQYSWQTTLLVFAGTLLLVLPLSLMLASPRHAASPALAAKQQSSKQALAEAFGHRSYVLLMIGYFVCGFHVAFVGGHLPAYVSDKGIGLSLFGVTLSPAELGGWSIGMVGLFNIVGSILWSSMGGRYQRKNLLSLLYLLRSLVFLAFVLAPLSAASVLAFAGALGFLWLGTVPLTTSLVGVMFGRVHLTMLNGFVFLGHQVGSFVGGWGGGLMFDLQGNYDMMWWLSIALGIISALLHWPIVEKPVPRLQPVLQPA